MDSTTAPILHVLAGFGMGISLIAAIGAQNAFVLRQGIRREHVLPVVIVCAASDAVLIILGIAGIGTVVERMPAAIEVVRWAGALFLFAYALLALRKMLKPGRLTTQTGGRTASASGVVTACLALTWLNPHVYLDTLVVLGSVANGHGESGRWLFGIGATIASVVWFAGLGYGARFLKAMFARPLSWRILDGFVAAVMLALGVQLAVSA